VLLANAEKHRLITRVIQLGGDLVVNAIEKDLRRINLRSRQVSAGDEAQ
jgi:hypothetical protein